MSLNGKNAIDNENKHDAKLKEDAKNENVQSGNGSKQRSIVESRRQRVGSAKDVNAKLENKANGSNNNVNGSSNHAPQRRRHQRNTGVARISH